MHGRVRPTTKCYMVMLGHTGPHRAHAVQVGGREHVAGARAVDDKGVKAERAPIARSRLLGRRPLRLQLRLSRRRRVFAAGLHTGAHTSPLHGWSLPESKDARLAPCRAHCACSSALVATAASSRVVYPETHTDSQGCFAVRAFASRSSFPVKLPWPGATLKGRR